MIKIILIIVLFHTPQKEAQRLKKEVAALKIQNPNLIFTDSAKRNNGYASAINFQLKKTTAEVCIVANPDISLKNITQKSLLAGARSFDIWGFAMRQEGKIYFGGEIDKWRMSGGLITRKPKMRFQPVDFVSGSFMCIKRKVIEKIGYFNESYFMYYEDVEYCYRARKMGFRVGIDSQTTYEHFETSKKNQKKQWYLARNRLKFLMEYGTLAQKCYEIFRAPKTIGEFILKK